MVFLETAKPHLWIKKELAGNAILNKVSTASHVATATLYTGQSRSAPTDVRGRRVSGEFGCIENYG